MINYLPEDKCPWAMDLGQYWQNLSLSACVGEMFQQNCTVVLVWGNLKYTQTKSPIKTSFNTYSYGQNLQLYSSLNWHMWQSLGIAFKPVPISGVYMGL